MKNNIMPFLDELESESIEIIREVRANFENPILLFSGGKDSIVLSHLIKRLFILQRFRLILFMLIQDIIFQKQ